MHYKIKNNYQSGKGLSFFIINLNMTEFLYDLPPPLYRLLPNKRVGLSPMRNKDNSASLILIREE